MPSQHRTGRPRGSKNVTDAVKGAIVTLKLHCDLDFVAIAGILGVAPTTPGTIYRKVLACAPPSPTLTQLLDAVPQTTLEHPGRRPKVRNGSALSAEIRDSIVQNGTCDIEAAVGDVLTGAGISLSRQTLIEIAHNHRDPIHDYSIVKGVRVHKPALDDEALELRRNYCDWLIAEYNLCPKLIFVCYDEALKGIGGRNGRGGKQGVWRPKGDNANDYPVHVKPAKFSLMICAATSTDTLVRHKRPCVVWVKEDNEQREEMLERVRKANVKARDLISRKRARAEVVGTAEERALRDLNHNIAQNNRAAEAANRAAGKKGNAIKKGTYKQKTAEQFYDYKDFIYKPGKGINGIWYAERILKDELFPYYVAVREANPNAQVYLVQDNVYLHGLGLKYCAPEIEELDIKFAPHPPNSPDLHPIEHCFGRLEGFLQEYEVSSASRVAKAEAEEFVKHIWQEDETMRQYMAGKVSPQYFEKVAQKCLKRDGNNNFTA